MEQMRVVMVKVPFLIVVFLTAPEGLDGFGLRFLARRRGSDVGHGRGS